VAGPDGRKIFAEDFGLLALFYSTTTRWAKDLGLTEDFVRKHLNNFADQLGFSKESVLNTQRN
jgi:hypothetical protein